MDFKLCTALRRKSHLEKSLNTFSLWIINYTDNRNGMSNIQYSSLKVVMSLP